MPLSPGDKLGPYEILSAIGAGGMGEVYKARDTRLDRSVAIKVLPDHIAKKAESLARFEREARSVASLNHPNICTLHDIGEGYMVMELIEGETLSSRIEKGPIPRDQALNFAIQIADALDRAHRPGVTHRDVKPQNIMLTRDGIKVLDFGLAKSQAKPGPTEDTLTKALTTQGTVMGTPQYMAPEQFEGKEADARSDIWAFGAVLYEIVTGQRAFAGKSYASLLGAILSADPAPMAPAPFKPQWLERLVRRCLQKDPDDRYQSMRDLVIELRNPPVEAAAVPASKSTRWLWAAIATLTLIAAIAWLRPKSDAEQSPSMTFSILPPPGAELRPPGSPGSRPVLSPDGSSVLFRTDDLRLYIRRLDSLEPRLLASQSNNLSFWSPDSKASLFFDSSNRQLLKIRHPDGAPEVIASGVIGTQGSWSDSGTILMIRVDQSEFMATDGGPLQPVVMPDAFAEGLFLHPEFLPGGQDFLFAFEPTKAPEEVSLYLATLRDGKAINPILIMRNLAEARFTPAGGGRILFVRNDNLYSQKLNVGSRKLEGEADLVLQGVVSMAVGISTGAEFSVARNGTLAWRQGKAVASQATEFDRTGKPITTTGPSAPFDMLALSPDEKHLLIRNALSAWLSELGQPGRTLLPKGVRWLGWNSGGSRLIGIRNESLVETAAMGSGEVRELSQQTKGLFPRLGGTNITPDGKSVVFRREGGYFSVSIEDPSAKPTQTIEAEPGANLSAPTFSPDSRWIAYSTTGTGGGLYVQPFPGPGPRRQIAPSVGRVIWRRDGREILYLVEGTLMSIPVDWSANPSFGTPRALFTDLRPPAGNNVASEPLAVSRDGSRIFFAQGIEQPQANVIHIKTGAFDRLH